MRYPLIMIIIYDSLIILVDNIPLLISIVPKILQLYGIIGWTWQGYQLYQDARIQYRTKRFLRATIAWSAGILLEYFLDHELYLFWMK